MPEEQSRRPWARIRALPKNVLQEHGPMMEPKFSQESYFAYYESHRAEIESMYKGALEPMLSKVREAYGLLPRDRGGCSDDEILNRVLPPALLQLLIMSDVVHGRDCFLGCKGEDTTKYSVTTSDYQRDNELDLLLYHKQVPLQVLEAIVSVHKPQLLPPWHLPKFVTDLVTRFFNKRPLSSHWLPNNCLHILDVYRKSLLRGDYLYKEEENENSLGREGKKINAPRYKCRGHTKPPAIPSATKLGDAKIEIIVGDTYSSGLMDITLERDTLTFPPAITYLSEHYKPVYINLIWFERLDGSAGMHFCTVLYLVNNLIHDPKDNVHIKEGHNSQRAILWESQIEMIKDLCNKYVRFERSRPANPHLLEVGRRLKRQYKENTMKEWRKDFYVRHLKTPWKIISLFAGSLLLSLYGVLGYYNKR